MTLHGENLKIESIAFRMLKLWNMLENSRKDVGDFWSLDRTACMMLIFAESGHLAFRATSALERGEETVELILRIVFSVNQICAENSPKTF